MDIRLRISPLFFAVLLAASLPGCGREASSAPPILPSGPVDAEIPTEMNGSTQVVKVTAQDSMRFNGNRFTVHSGQPVRIELTNIGHTSKEQMAHDLVILQPNTKAVLFNLQSAQTKANGYLPPDQMDKVLAFTDLAGPGQTVVVEFTAPAPGQYVFLCNFPGHYAAGMHGTMTVAP